MKYLLLAVNGEEVNVKTNQGGWQRVADHHFRRAPSGYNALLYETTTEAEADRDLASQNILNKDYIFIVVPVVGMDAEKVVQRCYGCTASSRKGENELLQFIHTLIADGAAHVEIDDDRGGNGGFMVSWKLER